MTARKRLKVFFEDEEPEEQEREAGTAVVWEREYKKEVKAVFLKVIVDRDNLGVDYNARAEVARVLREIAEDIEHAKPIAACETTKNDIGAWKRDRNGDKLGWFQYEEA